MRRRFAQRCLPCFEWALPDVWSGAAFVRLQGVDPNDPAIAAMLGQLGQGQKKDDKGPEGGAK